MKKKGNRQTENRQQTGSRQEAEREQTGNRQGADRKRTGRRQEEERKQADRKQTGRRKETGRQTTDSRQEAEEWEQNRQEGRSGLLVRRPWSVEYSRELPPDPSLFRGRLSVAARPTPALIKSLGDYPSIHPGPLCFYPHRPVPSLGRDLFTLPPPGPRCKPLSQSVTTISKNQDKPQRKHRILKGRNIM